MPDLRKQQLAVDLCQDTVVVTIRCKDYCAAIELYDRLCANAREGLLELELPTAVPRG